jgi:hypothetical protein
MIFIFIFLSFCLLIIDLFNLHLNYIHVKKVCQVFLCIFINFFNFYIDFIDFMLNFFNFLLFCLQFIQKSPLFQVSFE